MRGGLPVARHYWAIYGLGIEIHEEMLDINKLRTLCDSEEDDDFWDNYSLLEVIDAISENSKYGLIPQNTGENDCGHFLLFPAELPWAYTEAEKALTRQDIVDDIVDVLLPYLYKQYDKNWIIKNVGIINLGGED